MTTPTIDTPEFRDLFNAVLTYHHLGSRSERGAVDKLIAHIDAKIAEAVKAAAKPDFMCQALNEGNGVYIP